MAFSLIILGFIFIIGLCIGSFLNVVILRTISEESIVFPASKCPKCQNPLKWYHNIPVLSYLFLRGKCAFCKEPISIQYPIIELLTGLLFLGLFIKFCKPIDPFFGLSVMPPIGWYQIVAFIFAIIVTSLFIAIAGTDILTKKVADCHTFPLIGIGLIFSLLYTGTTFYIYHKELGELPKLTWEICSTSPLFFSLIAGIVGFVVMEIIRRGCQLCLKMEAFGDGDSFIAAGLGTVLGGLYATSAPFHSCVPAIIMILVVLGLSSILNIIAILPMFLVRVFKRKDFKTFWSLITLIIAVVLYFIASKLRWFANDIVLYISSFVIFAIGIYVCYNLISGLKNKPEDGLSVPFGPAMVAAGLVTLFFI